MFSQQRFWRMVLGLGLVCNLVACTTVTPTSTGSRILRLVATDLTASVVTQAALSYTAATPNVIPFIEILAPERALAALQSGRADVLLTASLQPTAIFTTPFGYMPLTIIVHPQNSLTSLTSAQTLGIFSGQLVDWAQVGLSPGGAIAVVSREDEADATLSLVREGLHGQRVTRTTLLAPTWEAMRALVQHDPTAIGYLPKSEVTTDVKVLSTEEELQVLLVAATLQRPSGEALSFIQWLESPEGQALMARYALAYLNP